MKQVLYINGDSWFSHMISRVINNDHPLFKNIFVINHSVPGAGNINIINRTINALYDLKQFGIKPYVCVGLSEVGRDFESEFSLCRPDSTNHLNEYLKLVLQKEIEWLEHELQEYQHYVCTSWVSNPNGTKSIIDFIEQDFTVVEPCYSVSNTLYNWLDNKQKIFKFTKESFVATVENKQKFENLLLSNQYINNTLHLDKSTSEQIYQQFFQHVLTQLKITDNQQ